MTRPDADYPAGYPSESRNMRAYAALHRYLDGEWSEEERVVLEETIATCPKCYEKMRVEQRVMRLVREKCQVTAPARLREQIVVRMRVQWEERG